MGRGGPALGAGRTCAATGQVIPSLCLCLCPDSSFSCSGSGGCRGTSALRGDHDNTTSQSLNRCMLARVPLAWRTGSIATVGSNRATDKNLTLSCSRRQTSGACVSFLSQMNGTMLRAGVRRCLAYVVLGFLVTFNGSLPPALAYSTYPGSCAGCVPLNGSSSHACSLPRAVGVGALENWK